MTLAREDTLPEELRKLVKEAGTVLGRVIAREAGRPVYQAVERLRSSMAELRDQKPREVSRRLREELVALRRLRNEDRHAVARAFTLFLELQNSCENAYRSLRVRGRSFPPLENSLKLVYVLTAHPTESRAPGNIAIFQEIQNVLLDGLTGASRPWRDNLFHQLELAWRAYPSRERAPRVKDEAEHIYRTALRPAVLRSFLAASHELAPSYLRTWVGGDKDGHPGVDANATRESLVLSRKHLLQFTLGALTEVRETIELLPDHPLRRDLARAAASFRALRALRAGDGKKVAAARKQLLSFCASYAKELGVLHPALRDLKRLFHVFPALVVPLEFREASDVLAGPAPGLRAISGMLRWLAMVSRGGNPTWYVRNFIVSMTESVEHLALAEKLSRQYLKKSYLPIVPLFETVPALVAGPGIVAAMLAHPRLGKCVRKDWRGQMEIMVGYSDSAKEGGVLPSRLAIADAMHKLEAVCLEAGVKPVFFQGSGGSVDRGGGSVPEQVAWWPRSALETYKVTIQGEMVERSFSNPEITRGQIERILVSVDEVLRKKPKRPQAPVLFQFAEEIRSSYRELIQDPHFLKLVGEATPYRFLSELKMGSRPARRSVEISVKGLRAIPWVLCWTQTRVLLQTWWGVGQAWQKMPAKERGLLRKAFHDEPVFTSFVKALGFTIAKAELPIWRIYLENSKLPAEDQDAFYQKFEAELLAAREFVQFCSESPDPLWFRPWLGASIRLRAPMIHPLNLLQVLALEEEDFRLFRMTAMGISVGMMTTG